VVESGAVVAAGAVLLPNTFVKAKSLVAGNPAVFVRQASDKDADMIQQVL
jgi:carbonic anhydrase/acetyltransferase-like protein (isoleucine patch superfamily)